MAAAEITSNITGVAEAAQGTSRGAADTQKASQQLVATSTELRGLIEQFKIDRNENGNGLENGATAIPRMSRAAGASS